MVISVSLVRGLAAQLKRGGHDVEDFCAEAGIEPASLSDPFGQLSLEGYGRAVIAAKRISGDPAFGLRAGGLAPAAYLALVGNLMVNCRTMRDATRLYGRFSRLIAPDITWKLTEFGDTASYAYHQAALSGSVARFSAEFAMALAMGFGDHFGGEDHAPEVVRFRHAAPRHQATYNEVFRCPVEFGAQRNELVFDRRMLDVAMMHDDEMVWSALKQQAEKMLADHHNTTRFSDRVKSCLHHEPDLSDISMPNVARRFGLTARGLRRRLTQEARPLSTLIAEVKCELACARLRDPESCIKQVGGDLGFSEPAAFHRAFKRWTGMTPSQYRNSAPSKGRGPIVVRRGSPALSMAS